MMGEVDAPVNPTYELQNHQWNYLFNNVNERDLEGNTALHLALMDSPASETVVKQLLDKSAPINAKNNEGQTPLHCALLCRKTEISIVRLLVSKGADLKTHDMHGDSPLSNATRNRNCPIDVIMFLIENGADLYDKDGYGDLILVNSLKHRGYYSLEALKYFLEKGVDVNICVDEKRNTLLHCAANFNLVEATRFLLSLPGIKADACNKDRKTPLFYAVQDLHSDPKLAEMLLEAGANVQRKNKLDQHPLHIAALHCNSRIVKLLLDYGALVNVRDKKGMSPLSTAITACPCIKFGTIRMLLDAGALIFEDHPNRKLFPDPEASWPFNAQSNLHDLVTRYMFRKDNLEIPMASKIKMDDVLLMLEYALLENPRLDYSTFFVDVETKKAMMLRGSLCLDELQTVVFPPEISLGQFIIRSRLREEENSLLEEVLEICSAHSFPFYEEVLLGLLKRKELKEWFQDHCVPSFSRNNAEISQSLDYDTVCEVMKYLWEEDILHLILAVYSPKRKKVDLPVQSLSLNSRLFEEMVFESKKYFKRARIN